jgi:hypothetical protein
VIGFNPEAKPPTQEVEMSTAVAEAQTLADLDIPTVDVTISDRCDRCGEASQAFFKFVKAREDGSIGVLTMCAHHGRKHEPVAVHDGWDVYDFSDRLNEKPTDPSIDDI